MLVYWYYKPDFSNILCGLMPYQPMIATGGNILLNFKSGCFYIRKFHKITGILCTCCNNKCLIAYVEFVVKNLTFTLEHDDDSEYFFHSQLRFSGINESTESKLWVKKYQSCSNFRHHVTADGLDSSVDFFFCVVNKFQVLKYKMLILESRHL